jgi:thiamine-phosphate pyrophosphorylase
MEIYALFDYKLHLSSSLSIEEFFSLPKVQSATLLQYRDKESNFRTKLEMVKTIREFWKKTLIINDDMELAMEADGLHVGQEDLMHFGENANNAVNNIRSRIGDRLLGLSTHNVEEIMVANELDLDYIGLGAYKTTETKEVTSLLGERISDVASHSRHLVAAIGGVRSCDQFEHIKYLVLGSDLYR